MSRIVVEGPRSRLVPFDERYLTQRYVDWLNDASLMRYSEQRHRRHSMESNADYMRSFDHVSRFLWAIVDRRDNAHIGNINAYVDRRNMVADLGLLIGDSTRHGLGFGAEAWIGAMHALFMREGIRKITGGCAAPNRAMLRIMQVAGMREDGIRQRQLLIDGVPVDIVHMAQFLDNFSQDQRYRLSPGIQGPFIEE